MMPTEVRDRLGRLDIVAISVGETHTEMVMLADELPALDHFKHSEEGVKVVSLYDPDVQPMWAEIASRYGEGWIYPILSDGRLVGAIEKWEIADAPRSAPSTWTTPNCCRTRWTRSTA